MANLDVKTQIRKPLKPSTPTPNHLQNLKLSLFDQLTPPTYVSLLFHFLPSSEWNSTENTERCDKLQKSLAEALAKFYPLAGRCNKDDMSIHCNDEGVEYVETKVDADLAQFLHEGPKIELLDDLLPWCCIPPDVNLPSSPLLGIQVNIFNCGGLVIGLQISHILADAFTLSAFVDEWAHISRSGTTKRCFPSFDHLPSLFPTKVLSESHQFSAPSNIVPPKIVTRRFVFDALSIAKLKNRIDSGDTIVKYSRVEVVMSLIWKVLVGISSAKHERPKDSGLVFAVNLRGKSNLPSLEHALGNFCTTTIATLEANQSSQELNDLVNLVTSASRDTSVGIGKASIDEIASMFIKSHTGLVNKLGQQNKMDLYIISSFCRFPWYEADFGWGKPFWVSSLGKPFEIVNLIDTKDGDGIEAWVSLKENDMTEFARDLDILTCCPPLESSS